jgi:hypothetical protein
MRKTARGATLLLISTSLCVSSCSFLGNLFGGGGDAPTVEGCPKDADQVNRLDWGLEEPHNHEIKAGLLSSIHIDLLAGAMSDELNEACGDLAKQMFVDEGDLEPEDHYVGADAALACTKVDEAIAKLKGIAGGELTVTAGVALCSTPKNAAKDCVAACRVIPKKKKDRKNMPPPPKPECEGEMSGVCKGNCSGQCTIKDDSQCAGTCAGLCEGSCDSEFTGVCRGKCEGTCDGEKSKGECEGTCQGRCLEAARGTCGGTCMGACEGACTMEAAGECEGVCSGECDKALTEQACTGILRLSGEQNECEAACDTLLMAEMECIPPSVKVKVKDPENEEAAGLLERALSQHLPKILAARALNLEAERIEQASVASKAAMEKMKAAAGDKEIEVKKKNKACIDDQLGAEEESNSAIPTILGAASTAQAATAGQ